MSMYGIVNWTILSKKKKTVVLLRQHEVIWTFAVMPNMS